MTKLLKQRIKTKNKLDYRCYNDKGEVAFCVISSGDTIVTNTYTIFVKYVTKKYIYGEKVNLDYYEEQLENIILSCDNVSDEYTWELFLERFGNDLGVYAMDYLYTSFKEIKKDKKGWFDFYDNFIKMLPKSEELK
jgi:hypothetical protein